MTRINVVPASELSRQHLIAEYRELPRVFALARKAAARGEVPGDARNPLAYTLGEGHVRFFYDKLGFLHARFYELVWEMKARGYSPAYSDPPVLPMPPGWWGGYTPTPEALAINRARIAERTPKKELDKTPKIGYNAYNAPDDG